MNKGDIIVAVREKCEKDLVSKAAAARVVNAVLDAISESLTKGENVSIVGFGTFKVAERAERHSKNPRTQEDVLVPAHKTVTFRATQELRKM